MLQKKPELKLKKGAGNALHGWRVLEMGTKCSSLLVEAVRR